MLLSQRLDFYIEPIQRLTFDLRDLGVEPAVRQDASNQAENGGDEIRFLLIELLPFERTLGHQVHFHRALGHVAQSQAHHLAKGMRDFGQLLQVNRGVNLNIAERIEVFDREVQFFGKKLRGVRHDRGPT